MLDSGRRPQNNGLAAVQCAVGCTPNSKRCLGDLPKITGVFGVEPLVLAGLLRGGCPRIKA